MMNVRQQIAWIDQKLTGDRYWLEIGEELNAIKKSLETLEAMSKEIAPKYTMYTSFVGVYKDFIMNHLPLFDFNAASGKALKSIIAKLLKCEGIETEEQALNVFNVILHRWTELTPFIQRQKTLPQMNKNLVEILDQLKNDTNKSKSETTAKRAVNDTKSAIEQRRARRNSANKN